MKYVDPPFELGDTLSGKDSDGNLINNEVLGKVFEHPRNSTTNAKARETGRAIHAVALRNESGLTLLGKRLGKLTETAGYSLVESVDGYAATLGDHNVVIIDPFLPSGGVADDDIFWGVIKGVVKVLVPTAGTGYNGDVAVGSYLVAATASSTGTSDAGRLSNVTIGTGHTEPYTMVMGVVGKAMSARTTHETAAGTDLLIDACIKY